MPVYVEAEENNNTFGVPVRAIWAKEARNRVPRNRIDATTALPWLLEL